jgi:hypothetical protein
MEAPLKRRNQPFTKHIRALEKKSKRKAEKRSSEFARVLRELRDVDANFAACAKSNRFFSENNIVLRAMLKNAIKMIDGVKDECKAYWTAEEFKRLEEMRKLVS